MEQLLEWMEIIEDVRQEGKVFMRMSCFRRELA